MHKNYKIALVGCGGMGQGHLKAIQQTRGIELVAIADVRLPVLKSISRQYNVEKYYTDYKKLLAEEELDAVAIVTNPKSHFQIALDALNNGLNVICEKPLTVEPKDSWTLVKTAKSRKRILAVTFSYHFMDDTRRIKELIDQGRIGKVREIRYAILRSMEEFGKPPAKSKQQQLAFKRWEDCYYTDSKGDVFDCGVHAFDLFSWYAGSDFKRVEAISENKSGYPYPGNATVIIELKNGARAVYDHGEMPCFRFSPNKKLNDSYFWISVSGSKGTLIWRYADDYIRNKYVSTLKIYTASGLKREVMPLYSKNIPLEYAQFAESLRQKKLTGYFPPPEQAAKATEFAAMVIKKCG